MAESREEMLERMKRVRAGRAKKASADVVPITDEQEFIVRANQRPRNIVVEPIPGEEEGMTSVRAPNGQLGGVIQPKGGTNDTVTMYKPTPSGWMPRRVTVGSIGMNLANGFAIHCPQCGGDHGTDPNECPGRDPMAVRVCPVCGKRIYDNRVSLEIDRQEDDPNVIQDDAYAASTPAIRTKAALDWHIWNRHPQEAREMGLAALAEAPKFDVPDALKGHGLAEVMGAGVAT